MIVVHHAPWSRSVRVLWLLEELGLRYGLKVTSIEPPVPRPFVQKTPFGKIPVLEDDGVAIFESGAIVEYLLERYGEGRLAPKVGSPLRGPFLQWVHFAEATAFSGVGAIAWHIRFKQDAEQIPEAMADYRGWASASLDLLERELGDGEFILGSEFSAADVMLGYSVLVAKAFGLLSDQHPHLAAYWDRLSARPALRAALSA